MRVHNNKHLTQKCGRFFAYKTREIKPLQKKMFRQNVFKKND